MGTHFGVWVVRRLEPYVLDPHLLEENSHKTCNVKFIGNDTNQDLLMSHQLDRPVLDFDLQRHPLPGETRLDVWHPSSHS